MWFKLTVLHYLCYNLKVGKIIMDYVVLNIILNIANNNWKPSYFILFILLFYS